MSGTLSSVKKLHNMSANNFPNPLVVDWINDRVYFREPIKLREDATVEEEDEYLYGSRIKSMSLNGSDVEVLINLTRPNNCFRLAIDPCRG